MDLGFQHQTGKDTVEPFFPPLAADLEHGGRGVAHHRCFAAWQNVFETERLYREVNDEVREMHNILLMRKTERIQRLAEEQRRLLDEESRREAARERAAEERAQQLSIWFGGIAFLLGFPSVVLSFLQMIGVSDWREAGLWLAGSVATGAVLMLIVHLRLKARMKRASAATGAAGNNPTVERRADPD